MSSTKETREDPLEEILRLREENLERERELAERISQIRQQIGTGEVTTGDAVKDFIVATGSYEYPETEEFLRALKERADSNIGQQVLVVRRTKRKMFDIKHFASDAHHCFPEPEHYMIDRIWQLGVLKSVVELDLGGQDVFPRLIFPMEFYAEKSNEYRREEWKKEEGPITIDWMQLVLKKYRVPSPYHIDDLCVYGEKTLEPELYFGEQVRLYFKTPNWIRFGEDLEGAEERFDISKVKEEHINLERDLDVSYASACHLLGVQAPEEFQTRYDARIREEKSGIIGELEKLTKQSRPKKGAIESCLKRALELGMDREESTIELEKGVTLNVPKYISGLAEKYKIEAA